MGTRGLVVIKVAGHYYAFYRNFDMYPAIAGRDLMEELIHFIRRFGGDVMAMCKMMRRKIHGMRDRMINEAEFGGPTDGIHWDQRSPILDFLLTVPQDKMFYIECELYWKPEFHIWQNYMWTLDFDAATLTMDDPKVELTVPMKHLYRFPNVTQWCQAFEESSDSEHPHALPDSIYENLAAARIQHSWRRWRAYSTTLEELLAPGTGLLFQAAQQRFEEAHSQSP